MKYTRKQWLIAGAVFIVFLYAVYRFGLTNSTEGEKWIFAATAAGVAVNVLFLLALLRQVKAGDRAVEMSRRAVDEARKTRIDESSPRVTVLMDEPMAILLANPDLDATNGNYNNGDKQPFHRPDTLTPSSSIGIMGTIVNEGDFTVRLMLNGPACFMDDKDIEDNMGIPYAHAGDENAIQMLEPGKRVQFSWYEAIPVQKLIDTAADPKNRNPGASSFLAVVASKPSADGITDVVSLRLDSEMVERVPESDSLWRYRTDQKVRLVENTFQRTYSTTT